LHFAGRFLESNFAVPASVVADRLERVRRGKPGRPPSRPRPGPPKHDDPPLVVGEPIFALGPFEEGVPADYVDRRGYDATFVGPEVPLPRVVDPHDVLTFAWQGGVERELKYEHFSVVMSRSRRLCVFSAANVDGAQPRRFKRPSWRLDPRIPRAQQIIEECYGNEPLFARGHMTRREDPVWGDPGSASLGNRDSMHVTNTVPQMQPFNAGIWLGLESYALDHARSDDMRIAVFTGPLLLADDPVRAGVRIPRSFWKVIAFVHDETRELCATGYTMSQDDFLRDDEFVFAQHQTGPDAHCHHRSTHRPVVRPARGARSVRRRRRRRRAGADRSVADQISTTLRWRDVWPNERCSSASTAIRSTARISGAVSTTSRT
jgi:endonuclease G